MAGELRVRVLHGMGPVLIGTDLETPDPGGLQATDQPGTFAVVSRVNVNECNACERLNLVSFLRWDGQAVTEIGATLIFRE